MSFPKRKSSFGPDTLKTDGNSIIQPFRNRRRYRSLRRTYDADVWLQDDPTNDRDEIVRFLNGQCHLVENIVVFFFEKQTNNIKRTRLVRMKMSFLDFVVIVAFVQLSSHMSGVSYEFSDDSALIFC